MNLQIDTIIARVLSGEASVSDMAVLSSWLDADADNLKTFRLLRLYWDLPLAGKKDTVVENESIQQVQNEQ